MTDTTLNRFLASGTAAQRAAFTPAPPTPASGPSPTYFWLETDTGDCYAWNASGAAWVQIVSGSGASIAWGAITGTLSSQADLQAALDAKQAAGSYAAASHTHPQSDITDLTTDLAAKLAVANNLSDLADAAIARTNLAAAAQAQTAEQISGFIASPSNKDYRIALDMKHGGTITEVTTRSASGTCTATWKINTTALGGTANSVSSTETTQAHSSANVFAAGDDIVLTVSANSSCADMSFTIKYTRTLA